MRLGFVVIALAFTACRTAGPGDLVGGVGAITTTADAGDAGSEPLKRQDVVCPVPPTPAASKTAPVPSGSFSMGCNAKVDVECRDDEKPEHPVELAAFEIDLTEVTQAQYYECVAAKACLPPTCDWEPCGERGGHPVVCVIHEDARTYCAWKGMRLPTEAEWERAARGDDGRKYPWGDEGLDCAHANLLGCLASDGKQGTAPVGSYAIGASPYGVLDMAGNVVELVEDFYDPAYYESSPPDDPPGPKTAQSFVGRGGGWRSTGVWHRASQRDEYPPEYVKDSLGFRCAK